MIDHHDDHGEKSPRATSSGLFRGANDLNIPTLGPAVSVSFARQFRCRVKVAQVRPRTVVLALVPLEANHVDVVSAAKRLTPATKPFVIGAINGDDGNALPRTLRENQASRAPACSIGTYTFRYIRSMHSSSSVVCPVVSMSPANWLTC